MSCGTPVAPFILVHPGVHFKAVEGDTLAADANFNQSRAHLPVKAIAVHAQVAGGVAESDQAGLDLHCLPPQVNRGYLLADMTQLPADGQARQLICLLLRRAQCLFAGATAMGGGPAGEFQVALLCIGVAQAVHF